MTENQVLDQKIAQLHDFYQNGELPVNLIEAYQAFENQITCLRVQSLRPTTIIKLVEKAKRQHIQKLKKEMIKEQERGQAFQAVTSQLEQLYEATHYYDIQTSRRWLEDAYHPCILTIHPEFEKIETFLQYEIPDFTVNENQETISMEEFLLQKVPYLANLFERMLKIKDRYDEPTATLQVQLYMSDHFDEIEQDYNHFVTDLLKNQYNKMIKNKKYKIFSRASVMKEENIKQPWDQISIRQMQQYERDQQQYIVSYQQKIQTWDAFEVTPEGSTQFIYDLFRVDKDDIQQRIHAIPWEEDCPSHQFRNQFNQLIKETAQYQSIEDNNTQQQILTNKLTELPNRFDLLEKSQAGVYRQPNNAKLKKYLIYKPNV